MRYKRVMKTSMLMFDERNVDRIQTPEVRLKRASIVDTKIPKY